MKYQVPIGLQPSGGYLYLCPDCRSIWPSDRGDIESFRCCDKRELDFIGTLADYLGIGTWGCDPGLLTEQEHLAMDAICEAHRALCGVIRAGGDEQVADQDIAEVVLHVHALQQMVMSQAAALRLLGARIPR